MVKSRLADVDIPDCTVQDLVFANLHTRRDNVALLDGVTGQSYTYKQLRDSSLRVASGLVRLGVQKGDVVMILSPNNPDYAVILYAILEIGAVVTTINPAYTAYEIEGQIRDSGASCIYTLSTLTEKVKEAVAKAGNVKSIISRGGGAGCVPFSQLLEDDGNALPSNVPHNPREDTAFILYSSGTTGLPKGVMLTHRNFISYIMVKKNPETLWSHIQRSGDGTQSAVVGCLPFFHMFGLFSYLISGMENGNKVVTMPKFTAKLFLELIEKHKVTMLALVPPIVLMLVKNPMSLRYNLSSVKLIGCGAAPLDSATENALRKLMPNAIMRQGYGLTEAMSVCNGLYAYERPASVGVLMPNTEMKVVDIGTGLEMGEGSRGELWIRGPQVMKGYLNRPDATRNTIDSQGWLHTGDVGYYDDTGHFYIVDRIKELIKVKGFQVAPAELEALLRTHPEVADVGVVGVIHASSGEAPRAFVVRIRGSHVTEREVQQFVEEKVIRYKWLAGGVEFVSSIPKSPSGKILRRILRDQIKTATSKL